MARRNESFMDVLMVAPWWVGVFSAVFVYGVTNIIIPNMQFEGSVYQGLANGVPTIGKIFSALFFACGMFSFIISLGRRKQQGTQTGIKARRKESLFDLVMVAPWWVCVSLAVVVYVVTHHILPAMHFESWVYQGLAKGAPGFGKIFSVFFFGCGMISAIVSFSKRKQLDRQTGINSIRSLGWRQFEELLGEVYRRQGYTVAENSGAGADGGVDLVLKKDGRTVLVQCKQWRTAKVGVRVVREMFGIMTAQKAEMSIIVTSGSFTSEAKDFAAGKAIDLVAEKDLINLIGDVQKTGNIEPVIQIKNTDFRCPKCNSGMVMRTARKGSNSGNKFWGCSMYPKCRGIVNIGH